MLPSDRMHLWENWPSRSMKHLVKQRCWCATIEKTASAVSCVRCRAGFSPVLCFTHDNSGVPFLKKVWFDWEESADNHCVYKTLKNGLTGHSSVLLGAVISLLYGVLRLCSQTICIKVVVSLLGRHRSITIVRSKSILDAASKYEGKLWFKKMEPQKSTVEMGQFLDLLGVHHWGSL